MQQTRIIMGMPVTIEVLDPSVQMEDLEAIFAYFTSIDEIFSTYKEDSEITKINRGELQPSQYSDAMKTVLSLSEQTKRETDGYFDIYHIDHCDPSGLVKGWAIYNAALLLEEQNFHNFYVDAGGDIQVSGQKEGRPWHIGIRNPFNRYQNVKILALSDEGIATSGTAIRGQHIYNPHDPTTPLLEIVSITVIGPNVYEADRFATAAFAMGKAGIQFIERQSDLEGYMIDAQAQAIYTSGLERYVVS